MQGSLSTAVGSSNPLSPSPQALLPLPQALLPLPQTLPRYSHIVAIDLGKFNSVSCRFDPATAAHSFATFATNREAITRELEKVAVADRPATLVVFETCEISGWVYDLIKPMGFAIAVANPATEAWRWTKVKRKTDKDDALKLAKLASMNQLPTVHVPSPKQRQKRRLAHHRRSLVQRRTASKNQTRSIFNQPFGFAQGASRCRAAPSAGPRPASSRCGWRQRRLPSAK